MLMPDVIFKGIFGEKKVSTRLIHQTTLRAHVTKSQDVE